MNRAQVLETKALHHQLKAFCFNERDMVRFLMRKSDNECVYMCMLTYSLTQQCVSKFIQTP